MQSLKINLIFDNKGKNIEIAAEAGYLSREDLEYAAENLYLENSIYANFVRLI